MSLAKQLYLIISFIFIAIFVGNFIITVHNTKEYLEEEISTKAQDAATSLGMSLKGLIKDVNDPEIVLTINAISDSGFYKEIRLEYPYYTITSEQLGIENIKSISVAEEVGTVINDNENSLENELDALEDLQENPTNEEVQTSKYIFIPSKNFKNGTNVVFNIEYIEDGKINKTTKELKLSNIIYKTTRDVKFDSVPNWFINMIDINLEEKSSEISDGWKTGAVIYVSANSGIAYEKLYIQIKNTLYYSIFAFIFSMILLALFLQLILKPLKRIESLTHKIAKGSFEQIEELPWTKELRSVSISINSMSSKIKDIITKLNKNIEDMHAKLNQDNLTKLDLKSSFETDMKELFFLKKQGFVYIVKVHELAQYATTTGRNTVDQFLIDFANILKGVKNSKAYRFFGSEFVLVVPDIDKGEAKNILKNLQEQYIKLAKKIDRDNIVHIGCVPFDQFSTIGSILSGATEAYKMAKQIGPNEVYIKVDNQHSRGMLEWKDIVFDIVDNGRFNLKYIGDIFDNNSKKLLMQEAFSTITDKNNESIPIGIFISVAQENNKIIDFDKEVVKKVIDHIKKNNIEHQIVLNLSIDSIIDIKFTDWLQNIIKTNKNIAKFLVFSLTSYGVAKNVDEFKKFNQLVSKVGSFVMIKRYETKFIPIELLKDLKPHYIRLAKEYTSNIENEEDKISLVDSICEVSHLLDIKVYCESANTTSYDKLISIGIDGVSKIK